MTFLPRTFEVFSTENDFELPTFEEKIPLKIILLIKKEFEISNT